MRPIVDFTRSPLQKLSTYLHKVLSPLVGRSATHVRHSEDFIDKVRHYAPDDQDALVSFDVVSLFTSVPIRLATETCAAALEDDPTLPERTPIDVPDLKRLLLFCLENTYFVFEGAFYKQVHGTPMGASISVTASNLTMEWLESRALASFNTPPKVFLRYVDDVFCIIQREKIPSFLSHLNSIEASIQFTAEVERDGELPFLDVLVKRDQRRLTFSVYRKSTHTGRYLHYDSVHPTNQKRSVVASLVARTNRICTTPSSRAADLQQVHRDLSACGYPKSMLNSVERQLSQPPRPDRVLPKKRAAIPYVPGVSEGLARVLRHYDVQVAHVPTQKLRHRLVNVKDKLQKEKFPGVVYRIPCKDCDSVYIGETGNFEQRIKQHVNDVNKKKVSSNALAEHAENLSHHIDFDNATILEKEKKLSARHHLESIVIQTTDHTLNRNDGTLPLIYSRCLRHILKPS